MDHLSALMKRYRVPGVSIAVLSDGQLASQTAAGIREAGRPEPVLCDTPFQACSISKPVAALAALRLVELGRLDLDADVNQYLRMWQVPGRPGWEPRLTLRQLLSHTAGLSYCFYRGYSRAEAMPDLPGILTGRAPANTSAPIVQTMPGLVHRYSGHSYTIVQAVIEDTTGLSFADALASLVFAPLGMTRSGYEPLPDALSAAAASGHHVLGEPVPGGWRRFPEMAAAGLWTTPADLAQVLAEMIAALRGEGRLLSRALAEEALKPHGIGSSYGLGFAVGGNEFGHAGNNVGYKCIMSATVAEGDGAVIMTNGDQGWRLYEDLLRLIEEGYRP